ncbi:hypothetical protein BT69DRAFT_1259287 [Atractiella rhizophila]|nr:hypothetical protein BT69DRAFT_1259287 [Atractiella rhizophila]
MEALKSYLAGDARGALETMKQITMMAEKADKAHEATIKNNTSPADVIMFSGCRDDQTSADTQVQGEATGAMSYAFIASLTKYPQQSYLQLLKTIREELKEKYSQKPQLSACHPIDTDLLFIM